MIPEDWQAMSSQDLRKLLEEKQAALTNLRFQKALQQLENPHQLRSARRDIARLQTVLKEIQLGSRKEAGVE
ncbi:MAG: 50S ribosomal protein L29 [Candidatus Neomarinimicrobiota bacterium]